MNVQVLGHIINHVAPAGRRFHENWVGVGVLASTGEYWGVLGSTREYWGVLESTGELLRLPSDWRFEAQNVCNCRPREA